MASVMWRPTREISGVLPRQRWMNRAAVIALAGLVVLLAAALRMVHPGIYQLWWDETLTGYHAMRLARHGEWIWVGNPMSTGQTLYHSPFGVYLTAVPYLLSADIIGPRLLYGLLGTAAAVAALAFVRRYYGWPAALVASLAVAVNPIAIDWSRFAWHPGAAAPCVVLWIMTGALGYIEGKRWAQIAHWLLLSLIIQADAALAAMLPLSVGLLIWRRAWNRTTLAALGLTALTLVPWAVGLVGVHEGWFAGPPPNDLGRSITHVALPSPRAAASVIGNLTSRYGYHFNTLQMSDVSAAWWPDRRLNAVLAIHSLIVLGGAAYLVRQRAVDRLVVAAFVWPFGFLFFSSEILSDFYMMSSLLAADIIFGVVFGCLWSWRRWTVMLAIVLVAAQAWLALAILDNKQRSDTEYSLSELQHMVRTWLDAGQEVVILDEPETGEAPRDRQEWIMKWRILGEAYPIRVVTEPNAFPVAPGGETLVSVASGTMMPAVLGQGSLVPVPHRAFRWTTVGPSDVLGDDLLPGGDFGDLMHVVGIRAEWDEDDSWPLIIVWQPLKTVETHYQFSVRLVGADGTGYGQSDGPALEPDLWRPGDFVVTRFLMSPVPAAASWHVELLLYAWPEISNVPVAGQDGVILRVEVGSPASGRTE